MKMLQQHIPAESFVKIVWLQGGNGDPKSSFQILQIHSAHQKRVVADNLRGRITDDLIHQLPVILHLRQTVISCRHVCGGDSRLSGKPGDTHQEIVLIFLQRRKIQIGSGRDDPHHFPSDQSFRLLRVFHLLTDGNLIALAHQTSQIIFHRMIRDAAHGRPLLKSAVLSRKCDFQLSRCRQGIFKKHFIKITEAVK